MSRTPLLLESTDGSTKLAAEAAEIPKSRLPKQLNATVKRVRILGASILTMAASLSVSLIFS
jgi:hypothetical protein